MLRNFIKSPANRAGLSAWIATALTAAIQYGVTRTVPPMADLLGILVGLVAMIQPDNSVTVDQLEHSIADLRAAMRSATPATIAPVVADAQALVGDVIGHTAAP
jgi:hypothetical protein